MRRKALYLALAIACFVAGWLMVTHTPDCRLALADDCWCPNPCPFDGALCFRLTEDGVWEVCGMCYASGETPTPVPTPGPGPTATPGPTLTPAPTPTPGPMDVCATHCVWPDMWDTMGIDPGPGVVVVDVYWLCRDPRILIRMVRYTEVPDHCQTGETPTPGPGGPPQLMELFQRVQCPHPTVKREPYPRGMVTVENKLWLESADPVEAASDPEDWEDYHDYTVHLRWEMVNENPMWDFDDGTMGIGNPVFHTYNTTSYGKPANGPGLGGRHDLPSYQVRVTTWWRALWKETWWEPKEVDRWECRPCGDPEANCIRPECPACWEDDAHTQPANNARCWTEIVHEDHDTGWREYDLRQLGYPTRHFARQTTEPVPIIEVQGVISK